MAVIIIVTGTPGTGKTAVAKELAKQKGYRYVDVNEVIDENRLIEKYDRKRRTNVVDENKVSKALIKVIKKGGSMVIDSHLSHCIPARYVNRCIITKCGLKTLKRRLKAKGYNAAKIRENLDAEIFDICLTEAGEMGHRVTIADTTRMSPKKIVEGLMQSFKHH